MSCLHPWYHTCRVCWPWYWIWSPRDQGKFESSNCWHSDDGILSSKYYIFYILDWRLTSLITYIRKYIRPMACQVMQQYFSYLPNECPESCSSLSLISVALVFENKSTELYKMSVGKCNCWLSTSDKVGLTKRKRQILLTWCLLRVLGNISLQKVRFIASFLIRKLVIMDCNKAPDKIFPAEQKYCPR